MKRSADFGEFGRHLARLRTFYGPLATPPAEAFPFFVWDIVSARAMPARRDVAWQSLKRLPALTPDAMFAASKEDLEQALSAVPGAVQRIELLKNGCYHFRRHRDIPDRVRRSLREAVRALRDVPHLSETARLRALLFVGRHPLAPVDDHVARVLARLEGGAETPKARLRRRARGYLFAACDGELASIGAAIVVLGHHAERSCTAAAPHCAVCPLASACRHANGLVE